MPKISEENRSSESARKSVLDRGRWSWTSGTVGAVAAGAFGTALAVFAWGGDGDAAEATLTRVQLHAAALRAEGEAGAETSDAWLAAGRRALVAPASVSPPFRDTARLPYG